jgi:hypothetical protein
MKIIGFEGSCTDMQTTYRTPLVAGCLSESTLAELEGDNAITLFIEPIEMIADWRLVLTRADSSHAPFLGTRLRPVETRSGLKLLVYGVKQEDWPIYTARVAKRCLTWALGNALKEEREAVLNVVRLGCSFGGSDELYSLWGLIVEPAKVSHVREVYTVAQERGTIRSTNQHRHRVW